MKSVSIILPVINEDKNIRILIKQINGLVNAGKLSGLKEIIFVDGGSTDSTISVIKELSNKSNKYKIKLINQKIKPGTAAATLQAVASANGESVIVMDADLQHTTKTIPSLIKKFAGGFDIVVASRGIVSGQVKRTFGRAIMSRTAEFLAYVMVKQSRKITDPLSGYFIVKKGLLKNLQQKPGFYKLLLYVMAANKDIKVAEIPFFFDERRHGVSKVTLLSNHVITRYSKELMFYHKLQQSRWKAHGL